MHMWWTYALGMTVNAHTMDILQQACCDAHSVRGTPSQPTYCHVQNGIIIFRGKLSYNYQ